VVLGARQIADLAVCQSMRRVAVASEGLVKMLDLIEWREVIPVATLLAAAYATRPALRPRLCMIACYTVPAGV
jgi:hypothetical protein